MISAVVVDTRTRCDCMRCLDTAVPRGDVYDGCLEVLAEHNAVAVAGLAVSRHANTPRPVLRKGSGAFACGERSGAGPASGSAFSQVTMIGRSRGERLRPLNLSEVSGRSGRLRAPAVLPVGTPAAPGARRRVAGCAHDRCASRCVWASVPVC